jgi:hypothetical protein
MLRKNIPGEQTKMFTYQWLGRSTESGVPPILDQSTISSKSLETAIAHAKHQLKKKIVFAAGETYSVRVFDNNSVLVWVGNIDNV